ncbi:MAG: DNA-binding transcriptional LysR family regulator [Gammaproteobacteria bacterium]|jgi:DNA-binding transcriptional LysR family regulator
MIKQEHLRCFVTVAELGSISAAAKRLFRSPSAISMTTSNLESEFDRPLFESDSKSRLTPFGAYVFEVASEQIKRYDRSVASMHAYARNGFGRVDIAAVPSFATRYLPGLLTEFIASHPNITLSIGDDSSTHIYRSIEKGDMDIGIVSPNKTFLAVNFHPLLTDPIGVVCSRSHPFASLTRPLTWGDIKQQTFITNGTCHHIQHDAFQAIVAAAEIDVQNTTSLLALVAEGVGITTLPRLAVPEDSKDVVFLTPEYKDLSRTIGIITPTERSLSPAASAFVETVISKFSH